jgi:hypothetical protein
MSLPFAAEHFFDVFARYNRAVWPMQAVLLLLAVTALGAVFRPSDAGLRAGDRGRARDRRRRATGLGVEPCFSMSVSPSS